MASAIASRRPASTRAERSNSTIPAMPHMDLFLAPFFRDSFGGRRRAAQQPAHRRRRVEQRLAVEAEAPRLDREQPKLVALAPPPEPEELSARPASIDRHLLRFRSGDDEVDERPALDLRRDAAPA